MKVEFTYNLKITNFKTSVQFSHSVMSDSLQPHGLPQARLRCPSPGGLLKTPGVNSWSLLKVMSIELVMPSNHLILFNPLLLLP